ncbi:MAG: hypothetical protein AAGB46_10170 [Verrucomicrobiota bacterium]
MRSFERGVSKTWFSNWMRWSVFSSEISVHEANDFWEWSLFGSVDGLHIKRA